MASFTTVADVINLTVPDAGEDILVNLSGTYNMVIELQKKVGEGAWKNIQSWSTANATVAAYYTTKTQGENLRLIVTTDTSGTCTALLTDKSDKVLHQFGGVGISTPVQIAQSGINLNGNGLRGTGVKSYAASHTLTQAENAGKINVFNVAGGMTFTLPAALGTGDVYTFFVSTTLTSSGIIAAASASDVILGGVSISTDIAGVTMLSAATSDTITMNGTTTGGLLGSWVRLTDAASGQWMLEGFLKSSGTEATPFSAAV
jgi:hypothetical protein